MERECERKRESIEGKERGRENGMGWGGEDATSKVKCVPTPHRLQKTVI